MLKADADRRAKLFLDFCAGRAWLLGRSGTSRAGERLFVFTHRTFMEFFAAEGLARNNASPTDLAAVVCDSYAKNASSVLPELVVTAAEVAHRGSAREILKAIKASEHLIGGRGRGRFLPLRLRIAIALSLQPHILDGIISDVFEYLAGHEKVSPLDSVANALFDLPRDPQARLHAFMIEDSEVDPDAGDEELQRRRTAFLKAWLAKELADDADIFRGEWQPIVDAVWDGYVTATGGQITDMSVRFYALVFRREVPENPSHRDLEWFWDTGNGVRNGLLLDSIRVALTGGPWDDVNRSIARELWDFGPRPLESDFQVSWVSQLVTAHVEVENPTVTQRAQLPAEGHIPLACVCVLLCERDGSAADQVVKLAELIELPISALEGTRRRSTGRRRGPGMGMLNAEELGSLSAEYGAWLTDWAKGRLSLLPPEDDE